MSRTKRYCLDPKTIRLLELDGIGRGHDLDAGCFHHDTLPRPSLMARLFGKGPIQ